MKRRVNWNSQVLHAILPLLFAIYMPFMGANKYIVYTETLNDGTVYTEYNDRSTRLQCIYPEMGCSVPPSGDVQ